MGRCPSGGDFDGDRKADIADRVLESSQWWVTQSNGNYSFNNALWTTWNLEVTWVDVQAGEWNNHQLFDLAGRVSESGQWWVALSTGLRFANQLWTTGPV